MPKRSIGPKIKQGRPPIKVTYTVASHPDPGERARRSNQAYSRLLELFHEWAREELERRR